MYEAVVRFLNVIRSLGLSLFSYARFFEVQLRERFNMTVYWSIILTVTDAQRTNYSFRVPRRI